MKYTCKYFIAFFLFLQSFLAFSSEVEFEFKQLSTEQHLPGASIQSVFQDSKGIIWLGIESIGLCKYDGNNFTVYEEKPGNPNSISDNFPLSFTEDSSGNLWIGTTNGLNKYDRTQKNFTQFFFRQKCKNCIPNNYIQDLLVDEFNNIWIATRKGISIYNQKTEKFYNYFTDNNTTDKDESVIATSIYYDTYQNIWIGTFTNGLLTISRENIKKFNNNPEKEIKYKKHSTIDPNLTTRQTNAIACIEPYDTNHILLGNLDGLFIFNTKTFQSKKYCFNNKPELENNGISALLKDKTGKIWIGYSSYGLLMIEPKDNKEYYFDARKQLSNTPKSNAIRDIFEDKDGLVWIATKFQGLYTYNKKQETLKENKYNELLNKYIDKKYILSIYCDSKNNIWIGTKYSGAYKFSTSDNKAINYRVGNNLNSTSISNDRIECFTEDKTGNIWIGTAKGLNKYNYTDNSIQNYGQHYCKSIVADVNGNIWIGTISEGILFFDCQTEKTKRIDSLNHWTQTFDRELGLRSISITSDTILWFSTFQSGLLKYYTNSGKLTHYFYNPNDTNSISGNMIAGVYKDNDGKTWVGTKANGLNIYNPERDNFTRIKKKHGLPPNTIYKIIQDNNNNYWMSSHKGIFSINKKTGASILLNKAHGLKNDILEINALSKTKEGLLLFGSSQGLNIFDPDQIEIKETETPIIISSIKVYDSTIAEDLDDYVELTVDYKDKYISIGFTVTEYSSPLDYNFRYKLENYDDNWIYNGNRNYATYTGLHPGEYIFKVTASQIEGKWDNEPLAIKLTITSPFWTKPYFIIGCVIFVFLVSLAIYLLRIRFIQANQKKLKQLVEEKTRNLTELNQQLEQHKANLERIVEERTRDLEEARNKAVNDDKLKSDFLANMSHEIRTPLNAVIGLSNILIRKIDPEDEDANLGQMIETNARALQQLINDIIDISKIEANQITINNESFPLNVCLQNIGDLYQKQIELYKDYMDIEILVETPSKDTYIFSDQIRIEQIIKNLINNALKFTKKGYVKIGYSIIDYGENKKRHIRFFVKDTGIGIDKNNLHKIFNRFEKSNTKENIIKGGTGLGLSISYNLAKLLGGRIWVESELNKGSEFYIEIELNQEEEISIKELLTSIEGENDYDWKEKNVLIAEDVDANYIILENYLSNTNINVTRVHNGIKAVEHATDIDKSYDIILMDISMPGIDGFEATQQIRKYSKTIPIIAQTAFAMDYEEKKILSSGFDGYLSKPINKKTLLQMMSEHLES